MKIIDMFAAVFCLTVFGALLLLVSNGKLAAFNDYHPYIAGFVQFMLFGGFGDTLSGRLMSGRWHVGRAALFKILIWGIGGVGVTLAFRIFAEGVFYTMKAGMLPLEGNLLACAFFTSSAHNLLFGPFHSAAMCVGANFTEMRFDNKRRVGLGEAVRSVDWTEFADFVLLKSIPFFWIPVNTIVFLLPLHYRVAAAAALSLVFGMSMAFVRGRRR